MGNESHLLVPVTNLEREYSVMKAFLQKGRISLFWLIFIFCRIKLIFGRLTCFDRKNFVL